MVELFALKVKFVTVVSVQIPCAAVIDQVPAPMLMVLVPVPEALKPLPPLIVKLVPFALASRTHPAVDAVHAPIVTVPTAIVPANVVIVQVVPPTQVLASKVTSSAEVGAEAPVAPPEVVDHIAVDVLSQVQVVLQTPNRAAASAETGARNASARRTPSNHFLASLRQRASLHQRTPDLLGTASTRRKRPKSLFMAYLVT